MLVPGSGVIAGGGGSKVKPPFRRRNVLIDWDHGTQLPAVEIRPGVAVSGDTAVTARRLRELGRKYAPERPALTPAEYVDEVEHLVRRLENTDAGRRLIGFFASGYPLPERRSKSLPGDYGPDDAKFGVNPRRWKAVTAAKPQREVPVNVVILQDETFEDHCHVLPGGAPDAETGLGAAPTVVFGPRNGVLIDRVALAPELVLGHELVHAVHVLSGSLNQGDHVWKAKTGSPEGLAAALFTAETGRDAHQFTAWLAPANAAAFRKLPVEQREWIEDMVKLHGELVVLARQALAPVMPVPEKPTGGVVFQKPIVHLEEARTHGADLTTAWFHGVYVEVDLRRIRPTVAERDSDSSANGEVQRLVKLVKPKEKAALAAAELVRQLRLTTRDVNEVVLARQLGLPTRMSYVPTLSKQTGSGEVQAHLHRRLHLPVKRADLPDAAFTGQAPHTALRAALAAAEPKSVVPLDEYVAALNAWESGQAVAADGWRPGDTPVTNCLTGQPIRTVTVATSTVPQQLRDRAAEVARDVAAHPGTPVDSRGNERFRRAASAPLPPVPKP
ncbi:hypothetical protein [Saccharothrix obliqua]|uniref:hypothetical protein n=1 Tax=Saccharothrix obliqua TaxID=2861747 RepID=UPI001C5D6AE5|nr:hypothetical protein [Saccharothrix obliqua]MBW4716412.1 hypothetical protein [Saccharothrix obliqua]